MIDGVDLLPFLRDRKLKHGKPGDARASVPHEVLGWRHRERWAFRRGDLKLIRHRIPGGGGELAVHLYDLSSDPGERHDLMGERPEDAASLRRDYDAWMAGLSG